MIRSKYRGYIKDGKIQFVEPSKFKAHCSKFEGKEIAVTISRWTKPRSDNQNRYYWGVVLKIIGDEVGDDYESIHRSLTALFLTDRSNKLPKVKSTTELDTAKFEEYLTKVRQWSSMELHVYIPLPNEIEY